MNINQKKKNIIAGTAAVFIVILTICAALASCSEDTNYSTPDEAIEVTSVSTISTSVIVETTEPAEIVETTKIAKTTEPMEYLDNEVNYEEEMVRTESLIEPDNYEEPTVIIEESIELIDSIYDAAYSPSDLKFQGVLYWGGWRWTWYSEKVLPGGGLSIPGRNTEKNTGFVCDGDGYICLASGSLSKGTIVDTPFGYLGKVYDCGCTADVLDVYVGW